MPPELADKVDPVVGLKELCNLPVKNWPAILSEGDRLASSGKKLTPELLRTVEDARKRVAAREAIKKAVAAGDPRTIVTAYRPELIDDWVDVSLVT